MTLNLSFTTYKNLISSAFIITSPPNFGYIEDTTPRPGYEKQIGVAVESFKLDRLANGNIYYVQSKHHGIEPTSDQFTVQVTDGKYKSAEVSFLWLAL